MRAPLAFAVNALFAFSIIAVATVLGLLVGIVLYACIAAFLGGLASLFMSAGI